MKTSEGGLALIKRFEGCRLEAYRCPEGVPTIGFGHTRDVRIGQKITGEEAERLLAEDIAEVDDAIGVAIRVPLEQHEWDALASWAYNVGVDWLLPGGPKGQARLVGLINAGRKDRVPDELKKFVRGGRSGRAIDGLVRRRDAEAEVWATGAEPWAKTMQMPQAVTAAPAGAFVATRLKQSWTLKGLLVAAAGWIVQTYDQAIAWLTDAAGDMGGFRDAIGHLGLDAKTIGGGALIIGLIVAAARQFQPRSGGGT